MKDNYTHILFIIDDSGSMRGLIDDSIGGFNSFVDQQKKLDGECRMDTMIFGSNGTQKYLHRDMDVNDIPELTTDEHNASSGMTSLIDSIAMGIQDLGKFLREKDESERPSKVMVNIFTDGMENNSIEFSQKEMQDMIEEQQDKYNWEFTFLASDVQASNFAKMSGFKNVATAAKDGTGMRAAYNTMTTNAMSYRSLGKVVDVQAEYDKEDKKEREASATT